MKKIIKYNLIALLAMVFFLSSCDDEDNTDYSDLIKTNPVVTITGIPAGGYNLTETETVYTYDVTISEAQVADIALYVTQIDGNATVGSDYEIVNANSRVYIPANSTTAQLSIKVLRDTEFEGEETFTLQIGDERTANANITPLTVDFTLGNYTGGDLTVDMSWDALVYDQYGEAIDATDVADMVLGIYDASGLLVVEADGAAFEQAILDADSADGSYYVVASFYAVEQYEEAIDIDLSLDFFQEGLIDKTLNSYSGVLQNNLCGINLKLAEIVKTGTTYTITEDVDFDFTFENADFVGNYGGEDGLADYYDANVIIAELGTDLTIDGLNTEWMIDWWGEDVVAQDPVVIILNDDGTFVIEEQFILTSDYDGDLYDYNIVGAGTYSLCNPISLHIEYEMINVTDGYPVAGLLKDVYGIGPGYFDADITLGAKSKIEVGKSHKINIDKSLFR